MGDRSSKIMGAFQDESDYDSIGIDTPIQGEIEKATLRYNRSGGAEITISGWALCRLSPIVALQMAIPGSAITLARRVSRPDIGTLHVDVPGSFDSGFQAVLTLTDRSLVVTDVHFIVILANGLCLAGAFELPETKVQNSSDHFRRGDHKSHRTDLAKRRRLEEQRKQAQKSKAAADLINRKFVESYRAKSSIRLLGFLNGNDLINLTPSSEPEVTVVILVHNRAEYTLDCLQSLEQSTYRKFNVLLIDNASEDKTPELLERVLGIDVVRNQENLHFVKSCNQAAALVKTPYILFLNNDTKVAPDAIEAAVNTFAEKSDAGVVGGKIIKLDGTLQEAGSMLLGEGGCYGYGVGDDPSAYQYAFEREVDFCSGAFFLTRTNLFKELGGFDEAFAPAYYEEVDYCIRLKESGKKVYYQPRSELTHVEYGSSDIESGRELQKVNREKLLAKHKNFFDSRPTSDKAVQLFGRVSKNTKKILLIDDCIPKGSDGSGYPRTIQILNALSLEGADVTLYPMNPDHKVDWNELYTRLPKNIEVAKGLYKKNLGSFCEKRKDFYDVVVVSRPHNMEQFLDQVYPQIDPEKTKIVYDAESIFAEREMRKLKLSKKMEFSEKEAQYVIESEMKLAELSDLVLVVNENDKTKFSQFGYRTEVLSYAAPEVSNTPSFDERSSILVIAPLIREDSPNYDGLKWFIREVLPILRNTYDMSSEVSVLGSRLNVDTSIFEGYGVKFLDSVDDISEVCLQHRLGVIPVRYGAGISLKSIEYARHGLPIVSTDFTAQLMGWDEGLVAHSDDPFTFAEKIHHIYNDKNEWTVKSEKLRKWAKTSYSEFAFKNAVKKFILSDL